MGAIRVVLGATLLSTLSFASCANPSATLTNVMTGDPAKPYLGRTKTEIIACAGFPSASIQTDTGEVLTYRYSGAGPVPGGAKKADKKSKKKGPFGAGRRSDKDWTCSASLTFQHDRLVRVRFAHKDVDSPYAYQAESNPEKAEAMRKAKTPTCTFSLPNC